MKYMHTEKMVRVGDRVLYNDAPGLIVFVIDDDSYSERYPKENWFYLGKGLGVELQDETRTLFHLDSSENQEDLEKEKGSEKGSGSERGSGVDFKGEEQG